MASNQFGNLFRITTWGESHGKAIGVVIDGCPAGLPLSAEEINLSLAKRRPGNNPFVSPRKEEDRAEIYSGIFEGKTTGAPLSILIWNKDQNGDHYEPIQHLLRPGHANHTYLAKYGAFDFRGAGRASARETACRVAAGAVAKKLLAHFGIDLLAYLVQVAEISTSDLPPFMELKTLVEASPLFCPDRETEKRISLLIEKAKREGDSLGGVVELRAVGVPTGLGDPIYEKLDALLAKGLLSLPACKGIEIGSGFKAASMLGSEHNDLFILNQEGDIATETNHSGGIVAGISNGMPLIVRAVFKPPSSIGKPQETLNLLGEKETLSLPTGSRHDPCIAIRATQAVEAMGALVLADALLMNRSSQLVLQEPMAGRRKASSPSWDG